MHKHLSCHRYLFLAGALILAYERTDAGGLEAESLCCEYRNNPQGLDETQPRLSWLLDADDARDVKQTAYQLLVASSAALLRDDTGDLWDSGKVASEQSIQVTYAGKPLASRQACFWKVRVYDQDGKASPWSAPATWTMGLLQPGDWQCRWIGKDETPKDTRLESEDRRLPARMLRKEFTATKKITRATVYFSGLGLSELYLNGSKVGNAVLSPGLTHYTKRAFYVTYDVTTQLKRGSNALGVWLGNGRFFAPRCTSPTRTLTYGYPKLLLQLEIDYADGTRDTVVSDGTWRLTCDGPIQANNEYDGETYDARREIPGWASTGFEETAWQPAQLVDAPGGTLSAQTAEPIRVTGTLKPVAITEPKPGVFIVDLGQNLVGWCRFTASGPAGATVKLRHAETLLPDGTLYTANLRSAQVTDTYTFKGEGKEVYEPRFTYHGFRYVEITGFPGKPTLASLCGCAVNDDVASAGTFTCSDPIVNGIYKISRWGTRGNYRSMPTDCPQRDERQGWLGDRSSESKGESYLFGIAALYTKWLHDMADAQQESGSIPDVCPPYWPLYNDSVTWPVSAVIIPGTLYDQYGDSRILARHYPAMAKWIEHMSGFVKDGIIEKDSYGDWCVPPEDPKLIHSKDPARKTAPALLATTYFYHSLTLMSRYATVLNKPDDAQRFAAQAESLKAALNTKYYKPGLGFYDNGTQTACVLPLAFGLVPPAERQRVFAHLVQKITQETHGHIGTGLIGGQWLNRVLTDGGRADLAYCLATNKTYPSWGYMLGQGATTVWELWNGNTADPAMNSGNHVMLVGDLVIWFYETLAGIMSDPAQPGFKHIVMRPQPVGDLSFVKASHRSPYGLISSEWRNGNGRLDWRVTIPANATATVYVPASSADAVTEGGKPLAKAKGVKLLRAEGGAVVLAVASGNYRFVAR